MTRTVLDFAGEPDRLAAVERLLGGSDAERALGGALFQLGTPGSLVLPGGAAQLVPALAFNPGRLGGVPLIRFDGFETLADGTVRLIDRKTSFVGGFRARGGVVSYGRKLCVGFVEEGGGLGEKGVV